MARGSDFRAIHHSSALALLLAGCAGCSARLPADAGPRDAAYLDRSVPPADRVAPPVDAPAQDTGPQGCAPPDAPPTNWSCELEDTGDGRWLRPGCVPAGCGLQIAVHPEREVEPLQWQPCRSGRSGCRELVLSWSTDPARDRIVVNGAYTDDQPWLWMVRLWETSQTGGDLGTPLLSLQPAEGRPAVAAVRQRNDGSGTSCLLSFNALGAGSAAHSLGVFPEGERPYWLIFQGSLGSDERWHRARIALDEESCTPPGNALTELACAGDRLAANFSPVRSLYRVDRDAARARPVASRASGQLSVVRPQFVGDDLYFETAPFSQPAEIWLAPREGPPLRLIARAEVDAFGLGVGEGVMAWLEGTGRDLTRPDGVYRSVSLWSSPLARDPSQLQPRRVAALALRNPIAYRPGFGFGYYLFAESTQVYRVVRLADGASWALTPDAGTEWLPSTPYWVGPEEFALGVRRPSDPHSMAVRTIYRLRFDALGEPQPAMP